MRFKFPSPGVLFAFLGLGTLLALHYSPQLLSLIEDSAGNSVYPEVEEVKYKNLDFKELSRFLGNLAEKKGGEYAYASLSRAAALNYLPAGIDIHLLGHVVGDILYRQSGIEGMKVCSNNLRNACSHSIVVGALIEFGVDKLKEIVDVCRGAPGGKGAYFMCIHGLGHGILAYAEYDMAKAIKLCEKIADSKGREYGECVGGVSMEMMLGVHDLETWKKQKLNYFKDDDPLAPCNLDFMPGAARPRCYTFLTPRLFEAAGGNLFFPTPEHAKRAFSFCGKTENRGEQISCYGGFGKDFAALVNERNIQNIGEMDDGKLKKIYEWCALADRKEGISACVRSAAASLYWGGENKPDAALRFCGFISETPDRSACFSYLIGAVSFYADDRSYRQEFCAASPEEFKAECRDRLLDRIDSQLREEAEKILELCADKLHKPACYDQEIPKLMDFLSIEEAFEVTKIIQDRDPSYAYCHVLGHTLSAREVQKDPSGWKNVITKCPSGMCSNGCLHGAFQERFRTESLSGAEIEKIKPDLEALCEKRNNWDPTGLEKGSCYHALGHLLMYITGAETTKSLALCEETVQKEGRQDPTQLCFDGVFMQIFQPLEPEDFSLIEGREVRREELYDFCRNFDGLKRDSCWTEGSALFRKETERPEGLVEFCSKARIEGVDRCYDAVVYGITARFGLDEDRMLDYCSGLPDTRSGRCFASVASRLIEVDYRNAQRASDFCAKAEPLDPQHECFKELLTYSTFNYHVGSEAFLKLCGALPEPWKTKCLAYEK